MNVLDNMTPHMPIEDKLRQLVPTSVSEAGLKRMDATIEQLARAASPGDQSASAPATSNRNGIWRAAAILALLLVAAALLNKPSLLSYPKQVDKLVINDSAHRLGPHRGDGDSLALAGKYSGRVNDKQGVARGKLKVLSTGHYYSARLDMDNGRVCRFFGQMANLRQDVGVHLGSDAIIFSLEPLAPGYNRIRSLSGERGRL